jgi:hypothetical protein
VSFTPSDEQINASRRIEAPTIGETVSRQTPLGIICMLRSCASDVRAPGPYPTLRNIKQIDCDKLYEFLNAIADWLECFAGLRKEGGAK